MRNRLFALAVCPLALLAQLPAAATSAPARLTPLQDAPTLKAPLSPVVKQWNTFVESLVRGDATLRELCDSLKRVHPDRGIDAQRLELYTAAIIEHERQLILLRAMRKAEFGKAEIERTKDEQPRPY